MRVLSLIISLFSFVSCSGINLNWGISVGNQGTTTISLGDTVTWKWIDSFPHNVQSNGFTSSSVQSGVGLTYSFTFNSVGTFTYNCIIMEMQWWELFLLFLIIWLYKWIN